MIAFSYVNYVHEATHGASISKNERTKGTIITSTSGHSLRLFVISTCAKLGRISSSSHTAAGAGAAFVIVVAVAVLVLHTAHLHRHLRTAPLFPDGGTDATEQ